VFICAAKPLVEAEKQAFHHCFAVNSPAAVNQQQVLKLAHNFETAYSAARLISVAPSAHLNSCQWTRSRPLARPSRAFGFAKFLSPFQRGGGFGQGANIGGGQGENQNHGVK
jgi:hypothetical protein